MTTVSHRPPRATPPTHTIGVEPIGPDILALDRRYAHTSTLAVVERSYGDLVKVCATDAEPLVQQYGIEATAQSYASTYGATYIPSAPVADGGERMLTTLAAARAQGQSLDTALLAAILALRFYVPTAKAVEMARYDTCDERVRVAGARRDALIERAGRDWLAAEYGDTPEAVTL